MMGFTDIHHHILCGMDDGARDPGEMRAMLRRAADDGIARIVATPHVTPGVAYFDRERYERALEEARACCRAEGIPIALHPGAEILYTDQTCRFLAEGRVPTLAGTEYVLVEFSPDIRHDRLCDALAQLLHAGFLPVIAHAERYRCLTRHPARAAKLRRELDIRFQVNCSSILRPGDFLARRFIEKLLQWDMLDAIATDAHRADGPRTVHMRQAWLKIEEKFGETRANGLADGHLLFEN